MGPDEEKRLRQLLFKSHQLPEPDWNLFTRATKRFSKESGYTPTKIVSPGKKDETLKDRKK